MGEITGVKTRIHVFRLLKAETDLIKCNECHVGIKIGRPMLETSLVGSSQSILTRKNYCDDCAIGILRKEAVTLTIETDKVDSIHHMIMKWDENA